MKRNVIMGVLAFFCFTAINGLSQQQGFNKSVFYSVVKQGSIAEIDAQISMVSVLTVAEKEAFAGTLLMKKAELIPKAKDKLQFFKEGRLKLESAIRTDAGNIEYRFLRLIIQEHAPKIVKYRNNIAEDSQLIRGNFKALSQPLQAVISDYSKTSAVLKNL